MSTNMAARVGEHAGKAGSTGSTGEDSKAVARRLQSELMQLMTSGDAGISAFPEGDNIFNWVGTIQGPAGTVYDGLTFKLSLSFTSEYPYKPPCVRFDSCWHPNVDGTGAICLDILKDKWSPVHNVRTVLLSIQSLLGEPNNESPLNSAAAAMWSNQAEFRRVLLSKYTPAQQ